MNSNPSISFQGNLPKILANSLKQPIEWLNPFQLLSNCDLEIDVTPPKVSIHPAINGHLRSFRDCLETRTLALACIVGRTHRLSFKDLSVLLTDSTMGRLTVFRGSKHIQVIRRAPRDDVQKLHLAGSICDAHTPPKDVGIVVQLPY